MPGNLTLVKRFLMLYWICFSTLQLANLCSTSARVWLTTRGRDALLKRSRCSWDASVCGIVAICDRRAWFSLMGYVRWAVFMQDPPDPPRACVWRAHAVCPVFFSHDDTHPTISIVGKRSHGLIFYCFFLLLVAHSSKYGRHSRDYCS